MRFSPEITSSLFICCLLYLSHWDVSVGRFEGCFLSQWEWLQKMFYWSPEGIFTADWRSESEWRFALLRFWTGVSRTLLYVAPWFYCPLLSSLIAEKSLQFSVRYSKFNSCNIILLQVFSRKTQCLGVYGTLSKPFYIENSFISCTALGILLYICVVIPLLQVMSFFLV